MSNNIVNAYNPRSQSNSKPLYDNRPIHEIKSENENLKDLIKNLKNQKETLNQEQYEKQPEKPQEYQRRVEYNNEKVRELMGVVEKQEQAIGDYQKKFEEFESNLRNIMKLDKDIHSRLVNPQANANLEANIKQVLLALNGKAPYDKLIKMIGDIKV